jgi:OOP family OmpA-OmpF porin
MGTKHIVLTLLPVLFSAAVHAGSSTDDGWYAGFGVGHGRHDQAATFSYNPNPPSAPIGFVPIPARSSSTNGFTLFGGYAFNPNWALEGAVVSFGKYPIEAPGQPSVNDSLEKLLLRGVATLPLGQGISAHAKLGVSGAFKGDYTGGLGMSYAVGARTAVRLDWDRIRQEKGTTTTHDLYTVGVVYKF